jgi:gallate decarboxylase subunit D
MGGKIEMLKEQFRNQEIVLEPIEMGDDLLILLYGGERSHIGSCILASPRPSLDNKEEISCTSSVINVLGHKDEEIGREVAETICINLVKKVVLVCGIHYARFENDDIKKIKEICRSLVERYLQSNK